MEYIMLLIVIMLLISIMAFSIKRDIFFYEAFFMLPYEIGLLLYKICLAALYNKDVPQSGDKEG